MSSNSRKVLGVSTQHWYIYAVTLGSAFANIYTGFDGGLIGFITSESTYTDYFNLTGPLLGLSNAMINVGIIFSNLFFSPFFTRRFGRRWSIIASCLIILLGICLQAGAVDQAMLIIGRFILGFGSGLAGTVVPAYQAEVAPREIRGRILTTGQTFYQIGALLGFTIGYGTVHLHGNLIWRITLVTMIAPALILLVIGWCIPESPRWLAQRYPNRLEKCRSELARIRRLPADHPQVEEEFREIVLALEYQKHYEGVSYLAFFKSPSMRKRLAYGLGAMIFAQLCGQQALLYYGILQFDSLGFTGGGWGMNLNILSSSIQLAACLISWLCTDKLGRRRLYLCALGIIIVSYIVSGALTDAYPNEENRGANIACVICIYLIQCSYAGALGALQWVYVGEIFPMNYREKGINLCQGLGQNVTQLWLNQVWPVMFDNISHNAYWIMAGFNVIAYVIFYKFYPETKGVPLEQMDEVFGDTNRVQKADEDEAAAKANVSYVEDVAKKEMTGVSYVEDMATIEIKD